MIISGPGLLVISAAGTEAITFAAIVQKIAVALATAILGKVVDALFGKSGDSQDLKRALEDLIREIAGLMTGAVHRALDEYHKTEAFDRLLALGDAVRPYDRSKDLATLEAAFRETHYPIRRLKSLDAEVGYGPFCMAASLQLGIAREMLSRRSRAMTKDVLIDLVNEHERYAQSQEELIIVRARAIKVGAISGSEPIALHPATDRDDPRAPEKRDVNSFEKMFTRGGPQVHFRLWAQKPEKYTTQGWTVIPGTWREFVSDWPECREFYTAIAELRETELDLESELERIARDRILTPAEQVRRSWAEIPKIL
jgi:hypothetical protein